MKMKLGLTIAAIGLLAGTAFADHKKIESGAPVGVGPGAAFQVVDLSGPNKGKQLCYY